MADAAYCQSLTVDGDGCVCITRETAEKLVTKKKIEKIEKQSFPVEVDTGFGVAAGLLLLLLWIVVR